MEFHHSIHLSYSSVATMLGTQLICARLSLQFLHRLWLSQSDHVMIKCVAMSALKASSEGMYGKMPLFGQSFR